MKTLIIIAYSLLIIGSVVGLIFAINAFIEFLKVIVTLFAVLALIMAYGQFG